MPIKRSPYLQAVSRDHHDALLLCWKIRTGMKKNVSAERIRKYAEWFAQHHLWPHFKIEETWMFPVLGLSHKLVKQALAEHDALKKLFLFTDDTEIVLGQIEKLLDSHIRFEERILFNEIQATASTEQLQLVAGHHTHEKFEDNLSDPFWEHSAPDTAGGKN